MNSTTKLHIKNFVLLFIVSMGYLCLKTKNDPINHYTHNEKEKKKTKKNSILRRKEENKEQENESFRKTKKLKFHITGEARHLTVY